MGLTIVQHLLGALPLTVSASQLAVQLLGRGLPGDHPTERNPSSSSRPPRYTKTALL